MGAVMQISDPHRILPLPVQMLPHMVQKKEFIL